jgi:predicted membrane protein
VSLGIFFLVLFMLFSGGSGNSSPPPHSYRSQTSARTSGHLFLFFYKSFVMKTALIVLAILAGVFLIFQIYLSMATNQTETQPYEVVRTEEGFEIRHYPAATLAVITSAATSYKSLHR